jgi:HK97 family phage portal protein
MSVLSRLFSKKQTGPKGISLEIENAFSSFNGSAYQNAAFRAAVDSISRHIGKLKAHTESVALDRLLQTAPNNYLTAYDLLYKAATDYYTRNNAFLLIQREPGGIIAFYNLSPLSVEFVGGADGVLYTKMLFPDGRLVTLPYVDVIHLRRHFANNELLGADNGPLRPLLDTAETLTQATAQAAKNAVNIRGILKFTSLVNPAQIKMEKEQFVRDYLGQTNNGGVAAVDQRFEFHPTNITPYSVPAEQINAVNAQICAYLGISPKIVDGSFSEDEFQSFYESTIEPFALLMSLEFTKKCGIDVTFTAERLEFSSAKTRISLLRELLPFGVVSVNEARKLLALPPVDDGDRRLQSLNYVSADKADKYQLESEDDVHGTA